MNERKFLKAIKNEINQFGEFTPSIVDRLLQEERQLQLANKENIFTRWLKRIKREKTARQIIEDNMELILERTADSQLNTLLNMLMNDDKMTDVIKNKFGVILERLYTEQPIDEYDDTEMIPLARNRFLNRFREIENTSDILIAHMDRILQGEITLDNIPALKGLSEEIDEKLNERLKGMKRQFARKMLSDSLPLISISEEDGDQLIDDYTLTVLTIVEELLEDENVKLIDIERIGARGGYSKVYKIGEKVLKIGVPRETYRIPNHPRILQPLTRTNLINEKGDNRIFGCIEISDEVEDLNEEDIDEEKLYQLYKELRDDGIIWTDAKFSNVGKLKRLNTPRLNGQPIDVDPQAVGMDKKAKDKILGAGDWVILDTDFIYRQEDSSIIWEIGNSYAKELEKRWQQERQGAIAEEYANTEQITSPMRQCTDRSSEGL